MLGRKNAPILEFDPTEKAVIEPHKLTPKKDVPQKCVLCFFGEVLKPLARDTGAKILHVIKEEGGVHPVYEIEHRGERLAFVNPGVGAPLAAGVLEEVIALGCRKFVVCGGAGVLDDKIPAGDLMIIEASVRDEGTSYHYLPPDEREAKASSHVLKAMEEYLSAANLPYLKVKSWTTDAFYRETLNRIKARKKEGCTCVEMEASALFAVAKFRTVECGQIVYAADCVAGTEWDSRNWDELKEIREALFWLAADICVTL